MAGTSRRADEVRLRARRFLARAPGNLLGTEQAGRRRKRALKMSLRLSRLRGELRSGSWTEPRPAPQLGARQRRDAERARRAARADLGLHVRGAGVSAASGRGRKRKFALRRRPQQQRRPQSTPPAAPVRRATETAPRRDPSLPPPSRAAPPGSHQSDGAAAAAAPRRGSPALGLPAPADSCSGSNPACIWKWHASIL